MKIVIPIHNTTDYIYQFQSLFKNEDLIFIFDRINKPVNFHGNYKEYHENSNRFLAGKMRNLGIEGIDDDVLFFDEDKVPSINPIPRIMELKHKYDCIIYFSEYNDTRIEKLKNDRSDDFIPITHYNDNNNFVYTCGIYLNKQAIKEVKQLNNGYLFHPIFDGHWGKEDDFLGAELLALGYRIGYDRTIKLKNNVSYGNSIDRINDFKENIKRYIILRECLADEFKNYIPVKMGSRLIHDNNKTALCINTAYNSYLKIKSFEESETNITQYFTYRRFPDFTLGLVADNTFALYYTLLSYTKIYDTNIFRDILICQNKIDNKYRLDNIINIDDLTEGITLFNSKTDTYCQNVNEIIDNVKSKYLILCNTSVYFKRNFESLLNETIKNKYDIVCEFAESVSPQFLIINIDWLKNNNYIFNNSIESDLYHFIKVNNDVKIKKINISDYLTYYNGNISNSENYYNWLIHLR